MKSLRTSFLVLLALLTFGEKAASADAAPSPDGDEELLRYAGVTTDSSGLLDFLRSRAPEGVGPEAVERLIRQLGSDRFKQRERAAHKLVCLGNLAYQPLRRVAERGEPEVAQRAKDCLREIPRGFGLPQAAVRLLLKRKPAQAVEVLLGYLPFAENENTELEVVYALEELGVRGGKVHPALRKALQDKTAARRAAAACIVGWRGGVEDRAIVRRLLDDRSPLVRLRAAQGLLASRDKVGLPALTGLLAEPDVSMSWQAEELLHWAAGASAPGATVGAGTEAERKRCRAAWQAWHQAHAARLDLRSCGKDGRRPGLVFLVGDLEKNRLSYVWLRGCDGKPRWRLQTDSESSIGDALLLPGNRILLAEKSVRERDLQGKILRRSYRSAAVLRRQPNGHLFIASWPGEMCEVDEADTLTRWNHEPGQGGCLELRQGQRIINPDTPPQLWGGRRIVWLNRAKRLLVDADLAADRVLRSRPLSEAWTGVWCIHELLPNGHWLVSTSKPGFAGTIEIDRSGKAIRQLPGAVNATRLRNGNTVLLLEKLQNGESVLAEYDLAGRRVWEEFTDILILKQQVCLPLVRFGFDQPADPPVDLDSVDYRARGLRDKDPKVRVRSALLLGQLGPKAREALPALLEAQAGLDATRRGHIQGVVEKLVTGTSLPILLKATKHRSAEVRAATVWLFYKYRDKPRDLVPVILAALKDESALVRRAAASSAGYFLNEKEVVLALIEALHDQDRAKDHREGSVSEFAAASLAGRSPHTKLAADALMEAVQNPNLVHIRPAVIRNLGYLAKLEDGLVPTLVSRLVTILKDPKEKGGDRILAAYALSVIGPKAKAAVPALRAILVNQKAENQESATRLLENSLSALASMGQEAIPAIPELLTVLNSPRSPPNARQYAADALGSIGPAARAAIRSLTRISRDFTLPLALREAATRALAKIGKHPPGGG